MSKAQIFLIIGLLIAGSAVATEIPTKIHVGSMGPTEFAERFRLLLEDELAGFGFIPTKKENAEAILTGVLTYRQTYSSKEGTGGTRPRYEATVRLHTPDGERIWGGSFVPKRRAPFKNWKRKKDWLLMRAWDVAKALAKASGRKPTD